GVPGVHDSICAKAFGQKPGKARQINQVEGLFLTRKHRYRCPFKRSDVLPGLLERHRIILRDRCESEFDKEPQSANQLIFMGDKSCPVFVIHNKVPRCDVASTAPGTAYQRVIACTDTRCSG